LLHGLVVHVEHIDRDEEFDTELVEPYRLPAAVNAAKVRLHVGSHAPVTAFIGRPVFESRNVRRDMLKAVHNDRQRLYRHVSQRDCRLQDLDRAHDGHRSAAVHAGRGGAMCCATATASFLSAAFRINFPIVDDRPETVAAHGGPVTVTERMDVARLGVKLARDGGFDKVAWDGSSNVVPSIPILEQLALGDWVELAHLAHEAGLECYVSAGCVARHMRDATLAAIDGVGVGNQPALYRRGHQADGRAAARGDYGSAAGARRRGARAVRPSAAACWLAWTACMPMPWLGEAEEHYRRPC